MCKAWWNILQTKDLTKCSCTKLCMFSPSIRITTFWFEIQPIICKVFGADCFERACKLIWTCSSSVWGGLVCELVRVESSICGYWLAILGFRTLSPCSSSTMRRKNREAQRFPLVNFSSQLKHKPLSLTH